MLSKNQHESARFYKYDDSEILGKTEGIVICANECLTIQDAKPEDALEAFGVTGRIEKKNPDSRYFRIILWTNSNDIYSRSSVRSAPKLRYSGEVKEDVPQTKQPITVNALKEQILLNQNTFKTDIVAQHNFQSETSPTPEVIIFF